ncbi:MAG: STAS domain-containing protein, partial [Myxococcales bacterium]|nr:STAS domain-containing protein [Myxococcales bacterium]
MPGDPFDTFLKTCPSLLFVANDALALERASAALERRLGLTAGASLLARVHDDDRGALAAALADGREEIDVELRIAGADGGLVPVRCLARRDDDGCVHGELLEQRADAATRAAEARDTLIERRLLRALMDNLEIAVWATDRSGQFIYHDGKALAAAGLAPGQFLGLNAFEIYPPAITDPVRHALETGEPSVLLGTEANGVFWDAWTVAVRGEGEAIEYAAGITLNITEAARRELRLKEQIETIQAQQHAIQELSAPLIEVWDRIVTVPLIGVIDSSRARDLMDRLLGEVQRIGARFAILDLTGV